MSKPVGMEGLINDPTILLLLSRIVFLKNEPSPVLVQELSEILGSIAIFNSDGCNSTIKIIRLCDPSFYKHLERSREEVGDYSLFEDVAHLSPYKQIISLFSHLLGMLPSQREGASASIHPRDYVLSAVILSLLGLLNIVTSLPATRFERLRIRTELDLAGGPAGQRQPG